MNNRLKKLRTDARLTQDEAAAAMGVSRGQYIKLERGERRLTADYIARAAKAFKVPQSAVIEEADGQENSIDNRLRKLKLLRPDIAETLHDQFDVLIDQALEKQQRTSRQ
jgi:transcriptional regulator with XRE-family HTH domain